MLEINDGVYRLSTGIFFFCTSFCRITAKKLFILGSENGDKICIRHPFYLDSNHFTHHSVITISGLISLCRMIYVSGRSLLNSFGVILVSMTTATFLRLWVA